jgi:hypothetical protein
MSPTRSLLQEFRFVLTGVVLFSSIAIAGKDYYSVLEVPRNADDAAIKRAYRKLSLKYADFQCIV